MDLKLDMSKAYDRVEWKFFRVMIEKMGFVLKWVYMIMNCISSTEYIVSVNGRMGTSFQASRL